MALSLSIPCLRIVTQIDYHAGRSQSFRCILPGGLENAAMVTWAFGEDEGTRVLGGPGIVLANWLRLVGLVSRLVAHHPGGVGR
jgi:hypothetical protein